jgi:CRISPR-associated endonuclease/helicase Cas3
MFGRIPPGRTTGTYPPIPFSTCPAKTFLSSAGETVEGRSVQEHCTIVGAVAAELIARLPPRIAQHLFSGDIPLVCAAHDIGKVSPYFYEKIRRACSVHPPDKPKIENIRPEDESTWGGHAGVTQVALQAIRVPQYIPEILGQHHGFSPMVDSYRSDDEVFGGVAWQEERIALVNALQQTFACDWPLIRSIPLARAIAGLTTVADWIGSGEHFEDPSIKWQDVVAAAVDEAGMISPSYRQNLSFRDVFGFPPREPQERFMNTVSGPGVYILEAPMGMGKTEAALYAAYEILSRGDASGIYFALPTQLTSNKIYDRFTGYLAAILSETCHHRARLLHSNAWLLESEMGEEGKPGGSWFNHSKRGLLTHFAVGTIDQALMAVMNVKHGFVRTFGLAGKVVILDEVHSYDAFTGTILDALIQTLTELRCTVIVLSATLTKQRKEAILTQQLHQNSYPLGTSKPIDAPLTEVPLPAPPNEAYRVQLCESDTFAINEVLARIEDGQQILWIENTVQEAQDTFLKLGARVRECGGDCGLLHSRFTQDDRMRIEDKWVSCFGKPGWLRRNDRGRLLVGTQVLEQSLDIDADYLVSRFAPSDMLLQRIGRLWRHKETPRAPTAARETLIIAPGFDKVMPDPRGSFGRTASVYHPYILCRSLEVWQSRGVLSLPTDIRAILDRTYADRKELPWMESLLNDLEHGSKFRMGRRALRQFAALTLACGGKTLPENKSQTRFGEVETCELLLLKAIEQDNKDDSIRAHLSAESSVLIPRQRHRLSRRRWRNIAATLMKHQVRIPVHAAPPAPLRRRLTALGLHNCLYLGHPELSESLLRVALVGACGAMTDIDGQPLPDIEYRSDLGFVYTKPS